MQLAQQDAPFEAFLTLHEQLSLVLQFPHFAIVVGF
jgi:hypothetical protein